jgi:hypothetical protein
MQDQAIEEGKVEGWKEGRSEEEALLPRVAVQQWC